ncbi:hypothetical protein NC653_010217 [Populus alba x Populus x berolinensis]|uniref:Malic enzyme N-terminal domain-containing protein n=1 Tax=Populus alba x Populus x berolinensis TaxID=444605 RepID=A0AAD6QZ96_9ROSI|nr:hypothetical protein NC653_010217 [Populus alba x Populus x berolinensis]
MHHQTHCLSVLEKGWGFRLSAKEERGKILKASKDWAERNIQVIVVTDGECIFGLGGLGCQVLMLINLFTKWMCKPHLIS